MSVSLATPDLKISLHLDTFAPRAARHHVALVDRPSPDLRDAVTLLTSELVTRAVQQSEPGAEDVELRVWMPEDLVRVEVRGTCALLQPPEEDPAGSAYELLLLESVADRWSLESDEEHSCMWFEIDRHPQARSAAAR